MAKSPRESPDSKTNGRLRRGDDRAALPREALDGGDLRVGHCGDIGQHEHAEAARCLRDVVGMDGQVRDARPVEGLHDAAIGAQRALGGAALAVEVVVRLRPDDADIRLRLAAHEDVLVRLVPAEDRLRRRVLTTVLVHRADVVPPGLDAAGKAGGRPQPHLRRRHAGEAERGRAELVLRRALRNELVPAADLVQALAGLGVVGEAVEGVAALMVEHDDLGPRQDRLEIDEAVAVVEDVAADHAAPDAMLAAGFPRHGIVEVPELGPPLVVPADPAPVILARPIVNLRQREFRPLRRTFPNSSGMADAVAGHAGPGIVGEPVGSAALNDLRHDPRQVLAVIGRVDAGDVLVSLAVGLALRVDADPVRMGAIEILRDAVRIHARNHLQADLPRRAHHIAVEVAIAERDGAVMQRELGRIIGDDAAGIDDDALHARPAPMLAPPGVIVARGIDLDEVRLAPAQGRAVPRFGGHRRRVLSKS